MTPIGKWFRDRLEKALGRYHEGQDAPERIREQVLAFANAKPNATRGEWVEFAASFAEECWGAAYVRGVEWAEREEVDVGSTPEEIADSIDPTWRDRPWWPGIELEGDPDAVPPAKRSPLEDMKRDVEGLEAKARRF